MDMALVRQLFENTIAGSEALGVDPDFRAKLQATLPKLLPFHVGSQGQLQEWAADFKEWEPTIAMPRTWSRSPSSPDHLG